MEKRLTKIVNSYISTFKSEIQKKSSELDMTPTPQLNDLFQFIFDYPQMEISKNDIAKRTRAKNIVPLCDRCIALRANNEQCTRRRKADLTLCGTHLKGTPHGLVEQKNKVQRRTKITVWAQDIKGIIYFIDKQNNVYDPQDIHHNVTNPKIIAKWDKDKDGTIIIPQYLNK